MSNKIFKKYQAKLVKEGILKSLVSGLIAGFTALLISALICWLTGFKQVWICAIVWGVVTAGVTPLLYYKRYRPNVKAIMKRIDELGLEERMLTMSELEGDESFIAKKQREDAMKALNTVNAGLIKIAVSVPLIITMSVVGVLGLGMTTVSALSANEKIKSGSEIIGEIQEEPPIEYEVIYDVEGEGYIEGEEFQLVEEGTDATGVLAVAEEGWVFICWSDGLEEPYREDVGIKESMTILATFEELEESEESESESGDQNQEGEESEEGEGKPEEGGEQQEGQEGQEGSEGEQPEMPGEGEGAGGQYQENNQVYDGETYYGGSTYDNAYEGAMDDVSQNGDISDGGKDVIGDYFDNIAKN